MIIEQGVITDITHNAQKEQVIAVSTAIKTTCGSCQAESNCSTSVVAKFFTPKAEAFTFTVDETVSVGQQVELGITESRLVQVSFYLYLLPIIVFVITTALSIELLADTAFGHELVALCVGLISTIGTFFIISGKLKADQQQSTPALIKILPMKSEFPVQAIKIQTID